MKKILAIFMLISIFAIFAACGENSYEPDDVQMNDYNAYNAEPQADEDELVEVSDIRRALSTHFDIEATEKHKYKYPVADGGVQRAS